MSFDPVLGGLILYLFVMLAVGFATYRYMNTLDDFVLGGRRLGPWVSAISERASGESAWFLLGLPLLFLANIFASVYSTLNNTAIQLVIPDHVRGRISSFLMMSFSLPLLGTLPVSALAEAYGAPVAVAGAAILAMVVAVIFYASSSALRNMDASVRKAMLE